VKDSKKDREGRSHAEKIEVEEQKIKLEGNDYYISGTRKYERNVHKKNRKTAGERGERE
jgi:hypothetical protein